MGSVSTQPITLACTDPVIILLSYG